MKKITFYGKDFSKISEAGAYESRDDRNNGIKIEKIGGSWYEDLLETFIFKYQKSKKIDLRFSKRPELFHKYVGVFRIKKLKFGEEFYDVTLEISCRFDMDDKGGKDDRAYFLAAMLLCMDPETLEKNGETVNITSFHQVMDIFLLFMYKNQLADAAKKGIFRKYQRFENNDSRPHGTIDIARHIRENMGLENGNIAYNYRELTANNPVNRLILAAYSRLREKYPILCDRFIDRDESVYSTLKTLQTELGNSKTNMRNIVKENLRPITHPYFSEYEALRKTCLKILRDENVSIFDADCCEETDAIYFDITRLWEKYLEFQFNKLLGAGSGGLVLFPQASDTFLLNQGGGGLKKEAQPDFLFKKGEENIAILDAKFKPHWEKRNKKYLTEDIDECVRNLAVFWTTRTGVIYPCNSKSRPDKRAPEEFDIIGAKTRKGAENRKREIPELFFDVVEVVVPDTNNDDFGAWNKELDQSVKDILGKYLKKISEN